MMSRRGRFTVSMKGRKCFFIVSEFGEDFPQEI